MICNQFTIDLWWIYKDGSFETNFIVFSMKSYRIRDRLTIDSQFLSFQSSIVVFGMKSYRTEVVLI